MRTFLTYDYELFMGDVSGSITNCLITPVTEILGLLNQYQIKATFFVDAALLYRLNELKGEYLSLQSQWTQIVENINSLEKAGHDIELHIHPQWYYSYFNGINWNMDLSHFKLSDLDRGFVDEIVTKSQELLESIIGREVHAFRAGGYSIQELSDYRSFFKQHHIFIDSTVLSGLKFISENQSYDYSIIPQKSPYYFDKDITKEDEHGGVLEVPITTFFVSKYSYLEHLLFQKCYASVLKRAGDGKAIVPSNNSLYTRASRVFGRDNFISASFDDANGRWIKRIFDRQLKGNKDLVVISHPKLHTEYSLIKMKEFLSYAFEKTEFMTLRQLI